jgi:hypothetical protein
MLPMVTGGNLQGNPLPSLGAAGPAPMATIGPSIGSGIAGQIEPRAPMPAVGPQMAPHPGGFGSLGAITGRTGGMPHPEF